MTPLHLAVWDSIRSDDYSVVKALLEYNADCTAEDNVLSIAFTRSVLLSIGRSGLLKL